MFIYKDFYIYYLWGFESFLDLMTFSMTAYWNVVLNKNWFVSGGGGGGGESLVDEMFRTDLLELNNIDVECPILLDSS